MRGLRWAADGPAWRLYVHGQFTAAARVEIRSGRYHWELLDGGGEYGASPSLEAAQHAAEQALTQVWG